MGEKQIIKLLIKKFSPVSCYFSLLSPITCMLRQLLKINCLLTGGSCQVAGGLPGLGSLGGLGHLGRVRKVLPQITSKVNSLVDRTKSAT
jgi:hypothetical protein